MGKKKFINKKQAATFQLIARDPTHSNNTQGADRVFIRVDNNHQYTLNTFFPDQNDNVLDSSSTLSTAVENGDMIGSGRGSRLPENVRNEILELGFPDDGYNYLLHLREINNAGRDSTFYSNRKAKRPPLDVKAYDASRVEVPKGTVEETEDGVMYNVAVKSVSMKLKNVIDLEVAALLDAEDDDQDDNDDNLLCLGSGDQALEEEFVVMANLADGGVEESDERLGVVDAGKLLRFGKEELMDSGCSFISAENDGLEGIVGLRDQGAGCDVSDERQQRVRRLLDDQFELLENQEYGSNSNDNYYGHPVGEEEEILAERLNLAMKDGSVSVDESPFDH